MQTGRLVLIGMNRITWQLPCLNGLSGRIRNAWGPRPETAFNSTAEIQGAFMLPKIALRTPLVSTRVLALWLAAFAVPAIAPAQQPSGAGAPGDSSAKPDSPRPKQEAAPETGGPSKSFIGYVTSRSIVFPDIATSPEPLSPGRHWWEGNLP